MTILNPADPIEDVDVCVVGAGPAGLAVSLSCARAGLKVLLLESGGLGADQSATELSESRITDPARHASMTIASARAFGGTSLWWGGRCVPFDETDFQHRAAAPDATWPIAHDEMSRWYDEAALFLGCDPARFQLPARGWEDLGDVRFDTLERWCPQTNIGAKHFDAVTRAPSLGLLLKTTVTDLAIEGPRVIGLDVVGPRGRGRISAKTTVIAAGGLGSTRILLTAQGENPNLCGGLDGPLGRFYAGHISGKIADLSLADPAAVDAHDFFLDGKSYARRRFTLKPEAHSDALLNIAFWLDNPPFHDPAHHNALLSAVWLALAVKPVGSLILSEGVRQSHIGPRPYDVPRHLHNVLKNPLGGAADLAHIIYGRYLAKPSRPGLLLRNRRGRYALHYHAEQSPNSSSRVSLSKDRDRLGVRKLDIDLRYQQRDVDSVISSHEILDAALRRAEKGLLSYRVPDDELASSVWAQASDGFHQTGTTRMGTSHNDSVVNADCRVHGSANLYVASSSVFPSSSQANPTLTTVALALRLVAHLSDGLRTG